LKYSKFLISTALATTAILSIGAASAADMAMKAAPYAASVQVFSWTGCYVGVHAGAGTMRDTFTDESGGGGLAGGQVGCNYQQGNWVFGAEGEGYWSGMKSTFASSSSLNSEGLISRDDATTKNKYDFSIAARAGIAFDRTFVYGKAGWVWGKFDFNASEARPCCSFDGGPFLGTASGGANLNGLLLGVGVEHAITNNWTVKLEYNYLKFGSKEVAFTTCDNTSGPAVTCFPSGTSTIHADKQIFKIGANYLFNMGGAPVVAKY
jgi:outer membrane immunogenic protein